MDCTACVANCARWQAQGTTGNVHDCEFDRNTANAGGAIFRGSSNGNIAGSVFRNNTAQQYGGAVYDSHVQVSSLELQCIARGVWIACRHVGTLHAVLCRLCQLWGG